MSRKHLFDRCPDCGHRWIDDPCNTNHSMTLGGLISKYELLMDEAERVVNADPFCVDLSRLKHVLEIET